MLVTTTATAIMVWVLAMLDIVAMLLPTTHTLTVTTVTEPTVITAKDPLMPSQLLMLLLRLTPRPTHGFLTTVWVLAMLAMLATTHTPTMEAAETTTELWFPAPANNSYAGYHPYAYYGGCRNNYGALVPCAG